MLLGGDNVSSMGLLGSDERAEVSAVALRLEPTSVFAHALKAGAVLLVALSVLGVAVGAGLAEVVPAVVPEVAVGVVDDANWVTAGHHFEDQIVGGVGLVVDVDADAPRVLCAGYGARACGTSASNLPVEQAGL